MKAMEQLNDMQSALNGLKLVERPSQEMRPIADTVPSASLKFRHELKYYVNYHQYFIIRQRLKSFMERDKHAGPTGEYHIRSLYFDDLDNKALSDKLGGLRDRNKYRIRIYNVDDKIIHFEKKSNRMSTSPK